jgi:tetratricopeptide (TPR) repeat protein
MVFGHTSIWYVNPGHYLLIGTMDPLSVNYRRFAERCLQEAVQKKLATVHLDNPMVVLSMLELDERGSAAYTGELPPHSDDKPCAEFVRVIETRKASNINVFPPALSADLKSVVADKNDSLALRLDSVTASAAASRAGEIAGWLDNYEEALDAYGKAIALFADDNRTRYLEQDVSLRLKIFYLNVGNRLLRENKLADARDVLQKTLAVDSLFAPAFTHMGLLYQMRRLPDSAIRYFQKAILLDPNDVEPYIHLGSLYSDLGTFDKALPVLQKAVAVDPRCAEAWFGIGYCFFHLGDKPRSLQAFDTSIKLGLPEEYRAMAVEMMRR